jgi:hypothetical protein
MTSFAQLYLQRDQSSASDRRRGESGCKTIGSSAEMADSAKLFAGGEDYVVTEPPGARSDNTVPLVFLFGWAGCRDRYLAKYGAIYDRQKFIFIFVLKELYVNSLLSVASLCGTPPH